MSSTNGTPHVHRREFGRDHKQRPIATDVCNAAGQHKRAARSGRPFAALERRDPPPHLTTAQALGLRNPKWSGHCGGPTACRSKEDIPCELLILLPSIVRPSVLTGCSQCSTTSPASTAARRAIRP